MKYDFVNEVKKIHENSPWYYRLTRSIFGYKKVQNEIIDILQNRFNKAGQGSSLNLLVQANSMLSSNYGQFTSRILGLEQLTNEYKALKRQAHQDQIDNVVKLRNNDIELERTQLIEQSPVKSFKSSTAELEKHLQDQRSYIINLERLPHPQLIANPLVPNDLRPSKIPANVCRWEDAHGNCYSSDTVAMTGKPTTYANMRKEISAVNDAQKKVQEYLNYYDSTSQPWQRASIRYDGLQGVKSYMHSWINQLWATAPHVKINEAGKPRATYPNFKKR